MLSETVPRLSYFIEGDGMPLVLIHGVGSRASDWDRVVERLGPGFRLLRYDLRGHGASEAPPGPYLIDDFVSDLVALMDEANLPAACIAGFSLGGLVAQGLALRHPARVRKLALLGTVAGRTDEERERVQGRLDFIASTHPASYFDQSLDRWFTPAFQAAHPEWVASRRETVTAMDQAAYAAAYHALAFTDFGSELAGIEAPTLVMTGEADQGSNPRMARYMASMIAGAELEILPGLRHSILIEAPDEVARALRRFFADGN